MNSNIEKNCKLCGRTITDEKNKTGVCPKCKKTGNTVGAVIGSVGVGLLLKKYGGKIIKVAINIIKK